MGRNVPVLFESLESAGWWSGLTDNYIRVRVPSMAVLANEIHSVHLTGMMGESAVGKLSFEEGRIAKKREISNTSKEGRDRQVLHLFC